jgi:NTP pyrophosphatase (non-canonical NTP hydrolase)
LDKEKFVSQLNIVSENIDMDWVLNVLKQSVDSNLSDGNPRGHRNLIIVMEELSELSKEISKELRGKGDSTNILEELADVQLGIYYVQEICNITNKDLNKAMNVKMKGLEKVLDDNGRYQ